MVRCHLCKPRLDFHHEKKKEEGSPLAAAQHVQPFSVTVLVAHLTLVPKSELYYGIQTPDRMGITKIVLARHTA